MTKELTVDPVEALTAEVFAEALHRVAPVVHRTPILSSASLSWSNARGCTSTCRNTAAKR